MQPNTFPRPPSRPAVKGRASTNEHRREKRNTAPLTGPLLRPRCVCLAYLSIYVGLYTDRLCVQSIGFHGWIPCVGLPSPGTAVNQALEEGRPDVDCI